MQSTILARFFRFAQVDPVDHQLRELSRQGSGQARIAHAAATLLVICFSAGSLVALGSDALTAILTQWAQSHTVAIPSAITIAVSTLLVLCCDAGMIYAASKLRVLSSRRSTFGEMWIHITIMLLVGILEASTYLYMSLRWEHPSTTAAGALIVARSLEAPVLAIYLSMARPVPVTATDIMAAAELASGVGVLKDVARVANDHTAPLGAKMKVFSAAAHMKPADRSRLDSMIDAVEENAGWITQPSPPELSVSLQEAKYAGPDLPDDDRPPTGGGSPLVLPGAQPVRTGKSSQSTQLTSIKLLPGTKTRKTAARGSNGAGVRTRRKPVNHKQLARTAWAGGATSVEKMRRATGMSKAAASSWVQTLKMERDTLSHQQPSPTAESSEVAQ